MRFISARKLLFILLFNIGTFVNGQTLNQVLDIANQQYKLGNYSLALKEYQRYLYFDTDAKPEVYYNIASCFQELNQYDKAVEYFDKAYFTYKVEIIKLDALFRKIENMMQMRDYGLALGELLGMSDTLKNEYYYKKEFMLGICYFGMEDFGNAKTSFVNCIHPSDTINRQKVIEIFDNKKNFYKPNPKTASILSICFPGLGQFYAGDIRNGANSILLTSALAFLGVRIALHQTIFDAFFTVMPWFQRYYQGGYVRAENIALQKRAIKRGMAYDATLDLIANTKK